VSEQVTFTSGMRDLLPFARPVRGRLLAAGALASLAALCELVPFLAIWLAVDAIVDGDPSRDALLGYAGLAAAGLLARYALFCAATMVAHLAAFDALHALRVRMAERLARVPLGWVTGRRSGEVKKVMADDVERLELFLAHGVPDAVAATVATLASAAVLAVVDWRMALATIVVVPVAFACMGRAMATASPQMGRYQAALARVNGALVEALRGLHVVKAFNRAGATTAELQAAIDDYTDWGRSFTLRFLPLGTAFYVLVVANVLVIVPVGLWLELTGRIALTELLLFFILGIGFSLPLLRLFGTFAELGHLAVGGNLVRELLGAAELTAPPAGASRRPADGSVRFEGVSFSFGERHVLRDVSFEAPAGSMLALVGPSGAGKTTIAKLVPRFWDVDAGRVVVGGVDVRELPQGELLDHVAFVFQESFLFDDTVAANIRLGQPGATDDEVRAAARAARADDFIRALPDGYDTVLGERGARLSGGERQRLALARAFLKDAPVLVLDEATAFADPDNEAAIQDALGRLAVGRTVLVVAHRLSTIAGADQILVVDGGRIVERGRHDELLDAGGRYATLWADFTAAQAVALGDAVRGADGVRA